jgi:hypothetical protein
MTQIGGMAMMPQATDPQASSRQSAGSRSLFICALLLVRSVSCIAARAPQP